MNLTANGVDLEATVGLVVEDTAGLYDGVTRDFPTAVLPGAPFLAHLTDAGVLQPRTITVTGTLVGANAATYEAYRNALLWYLAGPLELVFSGRTTRLYRAVLPSAAIRRIRPVFTSRGAQITLQFLCADPRAIATTDTVVDFTAGPTELPLGTAEIDLVTDIVAGGVAITDDLELTLAAADTTPLATLGLAATEISPLNVPAGETLRIDHRRQTVQLVGSGIYHPEWVVDATDFLKPALRPGDNPAGPYPTLQLAPALVAASAVATYRIADL